MDKIRKRNGNYVKFNFDKIINAILKAATESKELDEPKARKLAAKVVSIVETTLDHVPTVTDINDIIEDVLLASSYRLTAKSFILYKERHARKKEAYSKFNKDSIRQYLFHENWQVKENANIGYSLSGLNHYLISNFSKDYWLNELYTPEIKAAHERGEIHINDLSSISSYCCGFDLMDLMEVGFTGVEGKIESVPPKHFRTALGILCNALFTWANEISGAVAVSNFDTILAPFIAYDNLSDIEVEQSLQEWIFNMNVSTRIASQPPFSNITLDMTCPENFKLRPVLIGGVFQNRCYGEFQKEIDILNNAFFKIMSKGDARNRVFSFPVISVNITKEFDWDNPNLSNFWESLSKYGLPTFCNYINSDLSPEDATSMCCRLRIDRSKLLKKTGGLFGAQGLTGSVGVCTINLNRIGYEASNEAEFFTLLSERMEIAKNSLTIKRSIVEQNTKNGLYPYLKFYLRKSFDRYGEYWTNHFSTIGLCGGNEACQNLFGEGIHTPRGQEFMVRVLQFMNDKILEFQVATDQNFNLEQTPAESTSHRFGLLDQKFCEGIVLNGTQEIPYLTNSTQLPVNHTEDLFEILDLQDNLSAQYSGGSVVHLFIGETITDYTILKQLIKKICYNYKIPYFTLSPTFSICPKHKYISGEHFTCPECKKENVDTSCEVYARIVGYMRPVKNWNKAKEHEFYQRSKLKV